MTVQALGREQAVFDTTALLCRAAEALASRPTLWQPLVVFDPDERFYARIPQRLAFPGGFEAWLLTWLPGQGTGWHDHGGSAGAVAVVDGALSEHVLVGSDLAAVDQHELTPGQVRPFGSHHRHEMLNTSADPAVSIHVYAPELVSMTRYRLDGARLVPTAVERRGRSW